MDDKFFAPVIDDHFALPDRVYRGPVTAEKYAALREPVSPLAGIIRPGTWRQDSLDYLARPIVIRQMQEDPEAFKYPGKRHLDTFARHMIFNAQSQQAAIEDYVHACFPKARGRDSFAACLVQQHAFLLENEPGFDASIVSLIPDDSKERGVHADANTYRNFVLRLPTPGATGTLVDITADGLGLSGSEDPLPASDRFLANLAMVKPGDALVPTGQLMPPEKWLDHCAPKIPASDLLPARSLSILILGKLVPKG